MDGEQRVMGGRVDIGVDESPYLLGDFDFDGDVDLIDYATFQFCYSGHGNACPQGCDAVDIDGDSDVDVPDFAVFQANITGPG